MEGEERRQLIMDALRAAEAPVPAARLASIADVSRQIIVGDVAILRARGEDIIATVRGYMIPSAVSGEYVATIAGRHDRESTRDELRTIVAEGGVVVDVTVSHRVYGDLKGILNISTLRDVDDFIRKISDEDGRLLSELTDGIHLHTIACADQPTFERIKENLRAKGYLYDPAE